MRQVKGQPWDQILATWSKLGVRQHLILAVQPCQTAQHDLAVPLQIGSWPRSKALYGLDILLDATRGGTAQLLEVSFAPDFTSLLKFEPELVNDVVHACFSSEPPGEKFWRLGAPPAAAAQESIEQLPGYKELNEID